jgi:parallel beta-helix repeat protein/predicted outer membrane repeat protein
MNTQHIAAVTVLLAAAVVPVANADIINVDITNCPGPGDGSVGDPYCSIQTAIDNAIVGDEILVAPGTYFEAINFLGKAVWLHSSDGADFTTIDGTGNFHVVQCVSGEEPDTVLDGFTITGGDADGAFQDGRGGGMYNFNDSSPTVTNCTFTGNSAVFGGGMANFGNSSPTVTNCTFTGNTTNVFFGVGGGMYNTGSSPTVTDCTFTENSAGFGGGMYNENSSNPTVTNCTFSGNSAPVYGGGMYNDNSSPTVTNCTFSGNTGGNLGGGMANLDSSPTVINCTFSGNSAVGKYNGWGGGMLNSNSSPTVINCTFSENSATGEGGGLYSSSSSPALTNCILWDNSPDQVVDVGASTTTISYSDVQGGFTGTGNIDADPLFVNPTNGDYHLSAGSPCIDAGDNTAVPEDITTDLDGNPRFLEVPETPDTGNGTLPIVDMGAYESLGGGCLAVTSQEIVCHADGTTFTVNVEGLNACTGGTSMVTFTGSGGAVGEELCFTALVNDGGFCCSTEICVTVPDCSESEDLVCTADLDDDGMVGITDFLFLLSVWGTPDADLDGDGDTGITDFLLLLSHWGPCP